MPKLEKIEAYICPMTGLIVTPAEVDGVTASCFKCPHDGGWDGEQKCKYPEE